MNRQRRLHKRMDDLFPQESPDQCRVCNEPVVDGRWNYCSERCRDIATAVQRMFSWDAVREQVLERDDYTCQSCGLSREMWRRAHQQVQEIIHEKAPHPPEDRDFDAWRQKRRRLSKAYDVGFWADGGFQVDHIQRVTDGGHLFEESNLQTLCQWCHEDKTAEENTGGSEPRPEVPLEAYLADGGFVEVADVGGESE